MKNAQVVLQENLLESHFVQSITPRQIQDLIHSDITGPVKPRTPEEYRFFQVLIDDYSLFVMVKMKLKTS